MLRIICAVNENIIDEVDVRNVDVNPQPYGIHEYQIYRPKGYEDIKVFHDREKPWHDLAEKVLHELNEAGYDQKVHALADILMKSLVLEKDS